MIPSRIQPEKVQYTENRQIEPIDKKTPLVFFEDFYVLPKSPPIQVAVGKKKHIQGLYYYHVYAATETQFQTQIGVMEIAEDDYLKSLDKDNEPDPSQYRLVLYSFITPKAIRLIEKNQKKDDVISIREFQPVTQKEPEPEEEEDILIHPKSRKNTQPSKKRLLKDDPQATQKHILLPTETKEEAERSIQEFKKYDNQYKNEATWLQSRMKNLHYSVIPVKGDGHCFFHTLVLAFQDIGKITTVEECRQYLSERPSIKKTYQEERQLYIGFMELKNNLLHTNEGIDQRLTDIHKLLKPPTVLSAEDRIKLEQEKQGLIAHKKENVLDLQAVDKDIQMIVPNMEKIDTLEKYKQYVRTENYWANEWAIEQLENEFKVKILIFSKGTDEKKLQFTTVGTLQNPEYYIMDMFVHGNHYDLVEYRKRRIFTFDELPYSVKCLGIHNRMDKKIKDFKHFRCELNLGEDDDEDDDDENREEGETNSGGGIEPNDTRPILHIGSSKEIDRENSAIFFKLRKNKDWSHQLSDPFLTPLEIDGHTWNSVTHYVLAGHYKKDSPFYFEFTKDLGIGSPISSFVEVAEKAAKKPGVYRLKSANKNNSPKSPHSKIENLLEKLEYIPKSDIPRESDPSPSLNDRRKIARNIKFKNPRWMNLLKATQDAILMQDGRIDELLMKIRDQ